jgi:NAD(P)-dependent dehydrogenase (short-subunit alcohol dehydrogenase family)
MKAAGAAREAASVQRRAMSVNARCCSQGHRCRPQNRVRHHPKEASMADKLYIVTGTSRGLGAAIAERLLAPDIVLLCISRHINSALADKARAASAPLEQWPRDLADPVPVADQLDTWLGARDPVRFSHVNLINNAGVITRVGPVDASANAELSNALRVGLEAPLLLTAAFLRSTFDWPAERRVLNISSGLGRRAMAGSAAYCAAKAGMDNFSRAVALDEVHRGSRARIVSLAPGVIDTDMQRQLRAADASGFPDQQRFVDWQARGELASPDAAAARVLAYLDRADFGSQPVADVRE